MKKLRVTILSLLMVAGMALTVSAAEAKVTGTPFGLEPAWAPGGEFDKAWDGDVETYYDYKEADGGITGVDLGEAKVITKIKFFPRKGFAGRATGGKFQGSNSKDDGYVDLYTISEEPAEDWVEATITDKTAYRYIRYAAPNGGNGNIAEIELYSDDAGAASAVATESTPKTGDAGIAVYSFALAASLGSVMLVRRKKILSANK